MKYSVDSDSEESSFEEIDDKPGKVPVKRKTWAQKTFIIYPHSRFYKIWTVIVMIFCLTTAVIYPFCTAFGGIPYIWSDPIWLNLFVGELVMLLDIIIQFLLAYKDEDDRLYIIDFKKIAQRYIYEGNFKKDILIWLPLYELFKMIHPTLGITVLIKSTRFSQLFQYMDTKRIVPMLKSVFDMRLEAALRDPFLSEDINEDHNQIMQKLIAGSLYNILYLTLYIMALTYLVGMMWCILIGYSINNWTSEESKSHDHYNDFFLNFEIDMSYATFEGIKDRENSFLHQTTTFIYFAFTTLSTVGFGDYYPVSQFEHLSGSVLLLAGVATFSYIMGIFTEIINKFIKLDEDSEDSENLMKFFKMMKSFNGGREIDFKIQKRIIEFLEIKWKFDRNNCIQSENDEYLLD